MTRAPRCTWLIVLVLLGGCTAEFIVGASGESSNADADSSGGSTSNGADESETSSVTHASGDTSASGAETMSGEVTDGSSGAIESGGETTPETGVEAGSIEETGAPTTEGGVEEGASTGEPVGTPCAEVLDAETCDAEWHCDWFGSDVCWHDPCVDGVEATCDGLGFEDCAAAPVCIWIGEGEGECTYPDCATLEMAACLEVPVCAWFEGVCSAADCEPCFEFGMELCLSNEQCQWVESEEICSAS